MEQLLINAGLTQPQAAAYMYLLEHGPSAPPALTKELDITRSNAYKVLDSLEELGLTHKQEVRKKFVYSPADPSALASLVAQKRNAVIALEQGVNAAMQELRASYHKSSGGSASVELREGKPDMIKGYEQQAATQQPIHFIKSRADIPFLGYETMQRLRSQTQGKRFGITPDATEGITNKLIDGGTSLTRTWVDADAYTAPVEWSVSGSELHLQIFSGEGRVITINDQEVADSFRQIWHLLNSSLRADPSYKNLPQKAQRTV